MNTVEIKNLKKYFGAVKAVDGISFSLRSGTVHGFVGPNGAGKTTTMRIMATLDAPDNGDVLLEGRSLVQYPDKMRPRLGFMPDYLDTYADMIVREYLDFYARAYRLAPDRRKERLEYIVGFTGLEPLLERPLTGLSKGEKQRLSLARVLMNDPDLLILDEPAAGLDPRARVEFRRMVRQLADQGKIVFISSHILSELGEICDDVTIIDNGRLCASDSVGNLQRSVDAGTRVVIALHGMNAANRDEIGEKLTRHLAEIPGVVKTETLAQGAAFSYEGDAGTRVSILTSVLNAGFPVTDFYAATSDLEKAFMSLTDNTGANSRNRDKGNENGVTK